MKERFALLIDGVEIRTLEDLQDHFEINQVKKYFLSGELFRWLIDRYYDTDAEAIKKISSDDEDLERRLYEVFDIKFDVEKYERRKNRLKKLKTLTKDGKFLSKVDQTAFTQEELADLFDENVDEIYLCNGKFTIPLKLQNKKYIGVGNVIAIIRSKKLVDFDSLNIKFQNINFDDKYKIVEAGRNAKKIFDLGKAAEGKGNHKTALECYQKSADCGNIDAMKAMAIIYYHGRGLKAQEKSKAFQIYYKTATEFNDAEAMTKLAWCYELGEGVDQNLQLALKWYRKAAEIDNIDAIDVLLGNEFLVKSALEKNEKFIDKWKKKLFDLNLRAANDGDIDAMKFLAYSYNQHQWIQKALDILTESAINGDVEAMYQLAELYNNLINDPKKSAAWYKNAFKIYDELAKNGDINALEKLFIMCNNGLGTRQSDRRASEIAMTLAEITGAAKWIAYVGFLYCGHRNIKKDSQKAFEYCKLAADHGDIDAMNRLFSMYVNGDGVEKDLLKAEQLRQKLGRYFQNY